MPVRGAVRLPVRSLPGTAPRRCLTLRVAALEQPATSAAEVQQPEVQPLAISGQPAVSGSELEELEMLELDAAQEQLLSWMIHTDEASQEADLDEMVDYDEFGDEEYEELMEEVEQALDAADTNLQVGDKVFGLIYEVDDDGAYVEIGEKGSGFIPLSECSIAKLKTPLEALRVGMKREMVVVQREDQFGQTVLSLAAMEASVLWHRIRQMQEEDIVIKVKVDSANKGGLLVTYGPYEGFMPLSQFGQEITVENMEEMVGKELPAKFLEVDEERERLVFSNRRATVNQNFQPAGLKIGDVVVGTVQSLKPYGAFIDIGGVTGLLHVSQVSHERILHLDKIMAEGDKLKVMILSHDNERGRVTLSTKKLEPTPGDMLRNPQLVFEKAEEMADIFRQRVESAQEQINKTVDETGGAEGTPTAAPAQV